MDLGIKRGIRFVMLENPIVSLKPKIPNTIKKKTISNGMSHRGKES